MWETLSKYLKRKYVYIILRFFSALFFPDTIHLENAKAYRELKQCTAQTLLYPSEINLIEMHCFNSIFHSICATNIFAFVAWTRDIVKNLICAFVYKFVSDRAERYLPLNDWFHIMYRYKIYRKTSTCGYRSNELFRVILDWQFIPNTLRLGRQTFATRYIDVIT